MDVDAIRCLLIFLAIAVSANASAKNDSVGLDERRPRVTGRIVKLYSGTRPDPIICAREGFQADQLDCAVFYRCIKGSNGKYTVFRYQCGPGTVFDSEKNICNHEKNTKRLGCGTKTNFRSTLNTRPNENDIDFGSKQELPSPIYVNNLYHTNKPTPKRDITNHASALHWESIVQKTSKTSPKSFDSQYFTTFSPQIINRQGEVDNICENDGFIGDTENCRKFYRCVNNGRGGFLKYEFVCSESTVWDEETQTCNHPWSVKKRRCGRGPLDSNNSDQLNNDSELSSSTKQQQIQINFGNKVSQTQTQINNGSAIQNQTQINFGSNVKQKQQQENYGSRNKQNQKQVSHGSAVSQTQIQANYGDKGVQTQTQIDHSEQSSQSQTQVYKPNDESNYQNQETNSKPTNSNSDKCVESGFMADSSDCKKFYRCVDNGKGSYTRYEFSCGDGTVWDPKIDACNHAWAVKTCSQKKPATTSTNQDHTTEKITSTTANINSQPTSTLETNDYDEISYQKPLSPSATTISSQSQPENINTDSSDCKTSGFMGDKKNCKIFYRCVDNGKGSYSKYEFTCGEGTVWDPSIEACNHVWATKKCSHKEEQLLQGTTTNKIESPIEQSTYYTPVQNDDYDSYSQQTENKPQKNTTTTHRPQSQDSVNSDTECQSSGFIGDNNDCKKFYRCVDNGRGGFIRYEFSCGEGTVWDSKIEACNHLWAVPRCGGFTEEYNKFEEITVSVMSSSLSSATETDEDFGYNKPTTENTNGAQNTQNLNGCQKEGFMGDRSNCKKFYRCVSDGKKGYIKYEFTCGEGTIWDNELQTCNHPSQKNQCENILPQNGQESSIENDETVTESMPEYVTDSAYEVSSSSKQPTMSTDTCQSEGFYGDSNDCKKFYRCVDNGKGSYTKYDFNCGDGTVWDQEINACNHENSDRQCKSTQSLDSSQVQTQSTTEKYENTSTEMSGKPSRPNKQDDCTTEGFFANSNDCKKFYRCVEDGKGSFTKYDFTCGDGTIWVQEIQACDHDNDVSTCSNQNIQSNSTLNPQEIQDIQSDEFPSDNTSTSLTESSSPASENNDECMSEGFHAHKNDCKKFYRCVDDGNGKLTRYDFTCGEGTAWDQDLQTCNYISAVKSCDGSEQQQQSDLQSDKEQNQSASSTEESTKPSLSEQESDQTKRPAKDNYCESEGFFGDNQDCKKFYRCVDNGKGGLTKYDFTCGEGTIWDQELTTCNHPQDVSNPSCKQFSESSSMSSTTESSQATQTSGTTEKESENSSNCSNETNSAKPSKSKVNCTEGGFYPDPDDCKKFYRCVDWDGNGEKFSVYHFECGEGTIWDPALDTCNHEESVYPPRDCSKQSQSETVDPELTTESTTTESSTTTTESSNQTSTTREQTTEQQTTSQTVENTTTEKSDSTTQETTTKKESTTTTTTTTTEKTTTQQSSTDEMTTQSKEETTTESTAEITTQSGSNEETTTQQSTDETTTESSTTESSTSESTTDSTTESMTDQTTESTDSTTESSSEGEKDCPETDVDQYLYVCPTGFRRHPKYCNLFYQCTEDDDTHEVKVATFQCPNNTIYDEEKNQCVDESESDQKCNGEIAQKRRFKRLDLNKKEPIVVSTQKRNCPAKGHYPFERKEECSPAFLKCDTSKFGSMRGFVYRCPDNYVYWSVSRRCEPKSYLRNCDNSNNDWGGRYEIPVETRNVSYRTKIDERKIK